MIATAAQTARSLRTLVRDGAVVSGLAVYFYGYWFSRARV